MTDSDFIKGYFKIVPLLRFSKTFIQVDEMDSNVLNVSIHGKCFNALFQI